MRNSDKNNYFSGGLAELVSSPTQITYSFLKIWFTSENSVGKAMKLLNLPYKKTSIPILKIYDGNLVIDLKNEEETLYSKTLFKYKYQENLSQTPKQIIDPLKLINPACTFNTLKILLNQSRWIANQEKIIKQYEDLINNIPEKEISEVKNISKFLEDEIWPKVIAVGFLAEFYNQLLIKDFGKDYHEVNSYISSEVSKNDWFFNSISDQEKVRKNILSFEEFIKKYGLRSDIDYELTSPRWHEVKDEIKNRIIEFNHPEKEINVNDKFAGKKIVKTNISVQRLRSEAKRKTLFYINLLRQALLKKSKNQKIDKLENYEYDIQDAKLVPARSKEKVDIKITKLQRSGKGMPASYGKADGKTLIVENNFIKIPPNTIGIFSNASPQFAFQYPKCKGMIFLTGGLTSHGVIVAREFGIPALIDPSAKGIKNGTSVIISGETGKWKTS